MFYKTTSANFSKFGNVSSAYKKLDELEVHEYTVSEDTVYTMASYNNPVYIEPMEGMAMLRISENPNEESVYSFALHRSVCIYPNIYFSLVPMTGYIVYNLYNVKHSKRCVMKLEEPVRYNHITPMIRIEEILAYYYVVKWPHYHFGGEVHNFYELTYVDNGSLETTVNNKTYQINAQECMVYGRGEFHDQSVISDKSCSYLTIIFRANGIPSDHLLGKIFKCSRQMISDIEIFVKASDDETSYKNDAMIATLQSLIVSLVSSEEEEAQPKSLSPISQHFEDHLISEIVDYINAHLYETLPIDQICDKFSISRSTLQNLFKDNLQIPPKEYINEAKLSRSRTLIRNGDRTISEIASMLGFNSIHYFSRKFTHRYGITPSEFSRGIYDSVEPAKKKKKKK